MAGCWKNDRIASVTVGQGGLSRGSSGGAPQPTLRSSDPAVRRRTVSRRAVLYTVSHKTCHSIFDYNARVLIDCEKYFCTIGNKNDNCTE